MDHQYSWIAIPFCRSADPITFQLTIRPGRREGLSIGACKVEERMGGGRNPSIIASANVDVYTICFFFSW